MKIKVIIMIFLTISILGIGFLTFYKGEKTMAEANNSNKKTLVAYFSRTGEQYSVGNIKEGNTAIIAKMIAEKTGADLFEIKVVNDKYPSEYNALVEYAKKEKQQNARPEIEGLVDNFDDYDTIFIGYPNWWGDMPMPVYTFIESYNFSDKKIHHFCTHEGSGGVKRDGFAIYGHIAQKQKAEADKKVSEWMKGLGF